MDNMEKKQNKKTKKQKKGNTKFLKTNNLDTEIKQKDSNIKNSEDNINKVEGSQVARCLSTNLGKRMKVFTPNKNHFQNSLQQNHKLRINRKEKNFPNERSHVPEMLLKKFSRGDSLKGTGIKTNIERTKLLRKEKVAEWATEQAARTDILLTQDLGFIEPDENEVTRQFTQEQISKNVDIASAAKKFELNLAHGPYRMNYTKNGRFLLLGGRRGHIASLDWVTKKLLCETNVMEQVFDVQWLHQETMFAVAQKDWVYMYDNQGVELHCVKALNKVIHMEFLPYHFLLSTGNEDGYLGWLDISIGKMVNHYNSKQGRLKVMTQNTSNAVICLGHTNGTVTMWSPTVREPLVKMLCHKQPLTSIAIDHKGQYMVTAAVDRSVRVWDVRQLCGPIEDYKMRSVVSNVAFSQQGLVATATGNIVEIYKDFCVKGKEVTYPYLRQKLYKPIENFQFCPYEDVLGVGTYNGFTSLLVPGSGEPNFDAFEANPFQSKSQRRELEVRALLEKIQPEMITLDPSTITEVNLPLLKDKIEAKKSLLFVKPPKIDFTPKKKIKRHGRAVKMTKSKKIIREELKREYVKAIKQTQQESEKKETSRGMPQTLLDRFKPTPKKQKLMSVTD